VVVKINVVGLGCFVRARGIARKPQPTDYIISWQGSLGQRFTNVFCVSIKGVVCFVPFVTFRFLEKVTK